MAAKIDNADAALFLIDAAMYRGKSESQRVAQYKRVLRALDHLGITNDNLTANRDSILYRLDFVDGDGKPYRWLANRLTGAAK